MVVISVYTYGVKIIKKFRWESGFLWGFHGTPRYALGSAGYLMQLSVNLTQLCDKTLAFQNQIHCQVSDSMDTHM